jgi:hypothetical protein
MLAEDLDHEGLLELDPHGGTIRFGGQRALLLDAVSMGPLRKYLVENFGITAARAVLTQSRSALPRPVGRADGQDLAENRSGLKATFEAACSGSHSKGAQCR